MGVEATRSPFSSRSAQHARLLQHEALHVADAHRAPGSVVLTHHETLEEDEFAEWQAGTKRLSALLLASRRQYVLVLR